LSGHSTAPGSAFRHPEGIDLVRRIAETVGWGSRFRDKVLIAAYYGLLMIWSGLHLRPLMRGMWPYFWLGNVHANTSAGRFECRGSTTDFDIINPNYEPALIDAVSEGLMSRLDGSPVFVDVGAHIGKYTILAGRLLRSRGTVLAVEPDPDNFQALERNVARNALANVRCLNIGCWSVEGTLTLYRDSGNLGGHSFMEERGGKRISVPVKTLDTIIREEGIGRVDLIKIDVELAEFHVLQGARRVLESSPNVTVFFEESADPETSQAVRMLADLGFQVHRLAGITYLGSRPRKP